MNGKYYYGTGRRKSSVARVFLTKGTGQIIVNGRPVDEFFARETSRMVVRQPLVLTENAEAFDIKVNVIGGGETGQSGAIERQHADQRCAISDGGARRGWHRCDPDRAVASDGARRLWPRLRGLGRGAGRPASGHG